MYADEVLLTYYRESIRVGTSSRQHRAAMREEQREAAHPTTAERQHGLVRNPTDLQQGIIGRACAI